MGTFLERYEEFLGTGQQNEKGETLQEFLEKYDARKYETPSNTVDNMIFSYEGNLDKLKLLLIKRKNHPCIGMWALPGGFVDMKENLSDAAKRELYEETGIEGLENEFVTTYGDYDRDPRTRVITAAYVSLVPEGEISAIAGDDAADAEWFDIGFNPGNEYELKVGERTFSAQEYSLILTGNRYDITLTATTRRVWNSQGYIKNMRTEILLNEGISADHAAIITDGILHVMDIKNSTRN